MKTKDDFDVGGDRLKAWGVSEDYFEQLEDKVIQRWRPSQPKRGDMPLLRWLWLPVGVAASFLMMFFLLGNEAGNPEMLLNDEELAYYYLYTSEEEAVTNLWYDFSDIEIDDLEEWLANEDFDVEILDELY